MNHPAKNWCFTTNNYGEEDEARIRLLDEHDGVKYVVFGREVGASGTRHLQGFVSLTDRKRFSYVKELLPQGSHIEKAKGTAGDNRTYCSKEGDFEEFGEIPRTTNSSKLTDDVALEVMRLIRTGPAGVRTVESMLASQWLRNGQRFIGNSLLSVRPCARPNISVKWYHGPPGYGKSRRAHHELGSEPYMKDARTKWWHGYMLEPDVIIDDMASNGIHINHLLRWFDRYPCYVETKGGQVPLLAVNIIVTSNFAPEDVFHECPVPSILALKRRMTVVKFVDKWLPDGVGCSRE